MTEKKYSQAVVQAAIQLSSSLDLQELIKRILDELQKLINYDVASVLIKEGDQLKSLNTRGFLDSNEISFKISENPRLKAAIHSDYTIRFDDDHAPDPFDGLIDDPNHALKKVHSCMASPLLLDGKSIGIITLDSLQKNMFTVDDEDTLMTFATFAALAIRNARLVHQLEKSKQVLEIQNRNLREEINLKSGGSNLIGDSLAMNKLKTSLNIVSPSNKSILVQGPTGTGKEIIARYIHQNSERASQPLIYVNCAAIPENLIESELFGHKKGSFTGALQDRIGKFRAANKATLFLDEIGDLPLVAQPKLLRALQEGEISPVGDDQITTVDVRIISATNKDLLQEVEKGNFRMDLYHRISIFPVMVPPLNQRIDDIPLLVEHFIQKHAHGFTLENIPLRSEFIEKLQSMPWLGNVRELEHFIERALIWAKQFTHPELNLPLIQSMTKDQVMHHVPNPTKSMEIYSLSEATNNFQKEYISKALKQLNHNQSRCAKELGMDRSNFHRKIKKLNIV
ncbi:MAG: nitric oxide reductase transcriptional regulator NorR [Candidatus Cloacimonetes bacterium]|nr:nitric oxide reductase transcriptional regulator NorR [Candidatus Cloacimonadota bacterium]